MNKKHLSKSSNLLILILITLLHCIAVFGVYLLAEGGFSIGTIGFSYDVPEIVCFLPLLIPVIADVLFRKLFNCSIEFFILFVFKEATCNKAVLKRRPGLNCYAL